MYTMAGGSALTPADMPGTYRFIAAKRFEKIGWQEREHWYAHSIDDGMMLWVPASADQIACAAEVKTPRRLIY